MKKFTFLLLALLFVLGSAIAQNADKKWAIGLGPGVYYNLDVESTGFMPELYLSRYLSPTFDLMLKTDLGLLGDEDGKGVDILNPLLNLRLKLNNGKILSETKIGRAHV